MLHDSAARRTRARSSLLGSEHSMPVAGFHIDEETGERTATTYR
jgi:hypothetical protein